MQLPFSRYMLCSFPSHYYDCNLPQHALGRLLHEGRKPSSYPPPPGSHRPAPAAGSPCKHSWEEDKHFILLYCKSEICPYLTKMSMTKESSHHFKAETLSPLLVSSWCPCKRERKWIFFMSKFNGLQISCVSQQCLKEITFSILLTAGLLQPTLVPYLLWLSLVTH